MTLDEAIKHAEEVAEECQRVIDTGIVFNDVTIDMLYCDDTEVIEEHLANYRRRAEEHRQLAKWLKELKQTKWIPVSNPQKELPKDRVLWVTIDDNRYAQDTGGYYWMGGLVVTTIYWDMTEWSEDIVDYVLAYMDYVEPMPYKSESEVEE